MEATIATFACRAKLSRIAALAGFVTVAAFCAPTAAQATWTHTGNGTITVSAGGMRSTTNTDSGYAVPLAGLAFQKAAWTSTPANADWSALCTSGAAGACTSASVANGRYLVREAPTGAPAGWRALTQVSWGGASSGQSPSRAYVGDVTVYGNNATVRPSTSWSPTAPSSGSGAFVAAKNNPALPDRCGLDVLLLLDRSGSINPQKDTYRNAARQFVTSLSGTPTRLKISSFGSDTRADQASFLNLDAPADVSTANAKINGVYSAPAGSTNWDGGMNLAANAGVDVVVFITDGNPTYRDTPTGTSSGGDVDLLDLTAGVASANKVKTIGKSSSAGATILAVGAGTGVTAENLAAVSGPNEGDDYVTSSVAGLDAKLQAIANKLCGARVHVRQLTDDGGPASPKAGWSFTPGKPAGSPVAITPGTITTAGSPAEGAVTVDQVPAGGASAITMTQTPKPGYVFVASDCRLGGFADVTSGGAVTATIATVRRTEDWYCTFRSRQLVGSIAVEKTGAAWAYHGDALTFGFTVTNNGETPLSYVTVGDDRCATVTVKSKRNGAGQPDSTPGVLDLTDRWSYECSMTVASHKNGEANPIVNTVTAAGQDTWKRPVSDTDTHSTLLLPPALSIDKTGPATAQAGSAVLYTLVVTNPGDVPFMAPNVNVTDALCEAPPMLKTKNGDASPGQLDPGDSWTYTCTVQTLSTQTVVNNIGGSEGDRR